MFREPLSVLIVDDSALMRNLISRIFEDVPDINVAGTAMNGIFALQKIGHLNPDVIILDLEMPEMNGIEFLKERRKRGIKIPVIILSSQAVKGARITIEALELGASDFVLKPSGSVSHDIYKTKEELVELVRFFGGKYRKSKFPAPEKEAVAYEKHEIRQPAGKTRIDIIAVGISTGGPNALRHVLPRLSPQLPVPVLIVQHMPPGFTREFAENLNKICPLKVKEAEEGDIIVKGTVFIAPGDYHMEAISGSTEPRIHLSNAPPVNGHRPSADVLFTSVAKTYASHTLAIIMTGMGKDGAREIGRIYSMGGVTFAQDEESSVVFGMPKAAIENGTISRIVPLDRMAASINEAVMA
ncbi:MAG: chemotaxis response regulator protein-glutamate methylesterase [Spirochaetales bacterium]|nr:chemotaxis response regulator protein-glutamate methylesterase [Spirochaetales bacterium]